MRNHDRCAICGAELGTGIRCPIHGTPEQVERGQSPAVSTSTGDVSAIEKLLDRLPDGSDPRTHVLFQAEIGAARAELAALRATVEAQAAEIADMHRVEDLAFERVLMANQAYNLAHWIEDERHADLGVLVGWLLDERKAQAKQIETMRALLTRTLPKLSVACGAEDDWLGLRGESQETSQLIHDVQAVLSSAPSTNPPGSPDGSQAVVPLDRLRQIDRYVHYKLPCILAEFSDGLAAAIRDAENRV